MHSRQENGVEAQDGFESDDQAIAERPPQYNEASRPQVEQMRELAMKMVGPAQQIPSKSYSLHPDLITGWKPKIELPKPVPITFSSPQVQQLIAELARRPNPEITLLYLGPRFNNTYSAWKVLGLPFPYSHMGELRPTLTDRRFIGMYPRAPQDSLRFDSIFQSGNLDVVLQVGEKYYDCFMRVDANTAGHLQWFYFKITNLQPDTSYRINICNFQKSKSLYARGMRPYFKMGNDSWRQGGEDIKFSKKMCKSYQMLGLQTEQKYYKLSFTIRASEDHNTMEIAYCPPYTYNHLLKSLNSILSQCVEQKIARMETLCLSFGSLKVPLLTVTENIDQEEHCWNQKQAVPQKVLVFVMARLHPGQSNGSHMMEGLMRWLCGPSAQAAQLRSLCVFKLVPMANPDGVAMGNYRTGLSGRDFNRQFSNPDPDIYVEVYQLKKFLQKCKWIYQKDFLYLFDFHGHSVKKNVFAYGPQYPISNPKYYECRLFPRLLSRKTALFRFYSCIFRIHPSKAATARAVLLRQLGVPFPFTIEASNGFYYDYQQFKDLFFQEETWQQMGKGIGRALQNYMQIVQQISSAKQQKRKQKQLLRMKHHKRHRIQSSVLKNYVNQKSSPLNLTRHIPKQHGPQQIELKDILNCMEEEDQQVEVHNKCSDDEFSQGQSDSQGSVDDLTPAQLSMIFSDHKEPKIVTERIQVIPSPTLPPPSSAQNRQKRTQSTLKTEKKGSYVRIKTAKRTSFMTECDDDQLGKQLPQMMRDLDRIERPKRPATIIRRRVGSTSGTPSPTRQPAQVSSAKIINISFDLQPVPTSVITSFPEERGRKMKTQGEQQPQIRTNTAYKSDFGQAYRRTFLSLQRDMLRKQPTKRTVSNFGPFNRMPLKVEHIKGRRIFDQS